MEKIGEHKPSQAVFEREKDDAETGRGQKKKAKPKRINTEQPTADVSEKRKIEPDKRCNT
jgi:hypothetical protein